MDAEEIGKLLRLMVSQSKDDERTVTLSASPTRTPKEEVEEAFKDLGPEFQLLTS
jgi:hypothetical protein